MLSSTSRPTLIFPVGDPKADPPHGKCSHLSPRASKFSKGAAARRCALRAWRCVHRTPARVDRPGSNCQSTDFLDFSLSDPSKSKRRLVVACGGMRRLLEWSLGAASDDHRALDGGLSMTIGKPPAGNHCFSELSSQPGRAAVIFLSFFSRKRPQGHMDRKIFARAPED